MNAKTDIEYAQELLRNNGNIKDALIELFEYRKDVEDFWVLAKVISIMRSRRYNNDDR